MARALKVYRTAIGFHDAYVAAPSQKAALEAWDTEKNLFARGAAEVVTDPQLTEEPLANPGKVIKRIRGNLEDHLAVVGPMPRGRTKQRTESAENKGPTPKTKPERRPSRHAVDQAEAAIAKFEMQSSKEIAAIREKEAALRHDREAVERKHRAQVDKLRSRLERTETRYREALDRWRSN